MMENRICVYCKQEINPLRLKALPNVKTCVDCSTTGAKRGVPMMFGEKDHTWTDMVIMEPEDLNRYETAKNQKSRFDDEEEEENDDMSIWDNTLLDGLEDL
jgi:hypothetical protein